MQKLDPRSTWLFFTSFVGRWLVLMVFLPIFFTLDYNVMEQVDSPFDLNLWCAVILILFLIFCYIWARLSYFYYRYELREDGFRKEYGVLIKKYVTIPYGRIQNVDIRRGILTRLLGLSDLLIQTAGSVTVGSYGAFTEGRLPGVSREVAEQLRDELVKRAGQTRGQGL